MWHRLWSLDNNKSLLWGIPDSTVPPALLAGGKHRWRKFYACVSNQNTFAIAYLLLERQWNANSVRVTKVCVVQLMNTARHILSSFYSHSKRRTYLAEVFLAPLSHYCVAA